MFEERTKISDVAMNILRKRYFKEGETTWEEVVDRVVSHVCNDYDEVERELVREMMLYRYFIPNSPCLVNSGSKNGGLFACFVVDFPDSIEGIYKTKLDFALIAKKGGGCGTTLSKLRPENSTVEGSAHGYAGGPIKFFDTICHDMESMTQAGFRQMAMMGVQKISHPDIIKFITAKTEEGKMTTTNISVMVDNEFMNAVENDLEYTTYFDFESGRKYYDSYNARDLFRLITDSAWRNGEPGVLFYEKINNSPYKYTNQELLATNPCSEQPLPANGSCNLGSLDIAKFLNEDNELDLNLLETAVILSTRFLDKVIDVNIFPTYDIERWSKNNRSIGIGIMGYADYLLRKEISYGSEQALDELQFIMNFIYQTANNESINLGETFGVPIECQKLPIPRRNITLVSIAPTGTISLLAGCSSGIEPIFSEITVRNDKTGSYVFENDLAEKPYFRCAVSTNGAKEVTWQEHLDTLSSAQKFCDSGVSKTINCPNHTHKDTIYDIFMTAWKDPYIKGLTVYRNNSRKIEVLSPKNLKKDLCPLCGKDLIFDGKCKKCSDPECGFSVCTVG